VACRECLQLQTDITTKEIKALCWFSLQSAAVAFLDSSSVSGVYSRLV
jgi:hypothetical protein